MNWRAMQDLDDVTDPTTAELAAADNVAVFTDLRTWMTACVLLNDHGYLDNVTVGEDDDSQQLVRDARRLNRGWKPGVPVRAPLRRVPSSVIDVPERSEPSARPREQRPRRVRRSSGSRGDPSRSEEPEPPPLAPRHSGGAR